MLAKIIFIAISVVSMKPASLAQVIEFDEDKAGWIDAAGDFTTVHFADLPRLQFLNNQYEDLGVLFLDGDDIAGPGACGFPTDLAGCNGGEAILVTFDSPMRWIACDFPGALQFVLISDGETVFTSSQFSIGGLRHFAGLVAEGEFDEAIITDPRGGVFIDNLHFGPSERTALPEIEDCNGNGFVDFCDTPGWSFDCNRNKVPDECEVPPPCLGDADGNCAVDLDDLMTVISEWAQVESDADVNGSGLVDVEDLIAVVLGWGTC